MREAIAAYFAYRAEMRAKRKLFRQTYDALDALTDAELADIGINRSMIKGIAQEAADTQ